MINSPRARWLTAATVLTAGLLAILPTGAVSFPPFRQAGPSGASAQAQAALQQMMQLRMQLQQMQQAQRQRPAHPVHPTGSPTQAVTRGTAGGQPSWSARAGSSRSPGSNRSNPYRLSLAQPGQQRTPGSGRSNRQAVIGPSPSGRDPGKSLGAHQKGDKAPHQAVTTGSGGQRSSPGIHPANGHEKSGSGKSPKGHQVTPKTPLNPAGPPPAPANPTPPPPGPPKTPPAPANPTASPNPPPAPANPTPTPTPAPANPTPPTPVAANPSPASPAATPNPMTQQNTAVTDALLALALSQGQPSSKPAPPSPPPLSLLPANHGNVPTQPIAPLSGGSSSWLNNLVGPQLAPVVGPLAFPGSYGNNATNLSGMGQANYGALTNYYNTLPSSSFGYNPGAVTGVGLAGQQFSNAANGLFGATSQPAGGWGSW